VVEVRWKLKTANYAPALIRNDIGKKCFDYGITPDAGQKAAADNGVPRD
jgi:hypothetical protein